MELVTLKQAINHWIKVGLLPAEHGFKLEIDKVSESNTYCFTAAEVEAMIRHCRETDTYRHAYSVSRFDFGDHSRHLLAVTPAVGSYF